jgi:hypothetical protein
MNKHLFEKYQGLKPIYRCGIALLLGLFILGIIGLLVRNQFIDSFVQRKLSALSKQYHAEIKVDKVSFSGLTGVQLKNLTIRQKDRQPLVTLGEIRINVRLWPLLRGRLGVKSVSVRDFQFSAIRDSLHWNYAFLFRKDTLRRDSTPTTSGLARRVFKITEALFLKLPSSADFRNCIFSVSDSAYTAELKIPELLVKNGNFESVVFTRDSLKTDSLRIKGTINPDDRQLDILFCKNQMKPFKFPWLEHRYGLDFEFDTIRFAFDRNELDADTFVTQGLMSAAGVQLKHWRIADSTVVLERGSLNFKIKLDDKSLELDSASTVSYNQIAFNPWVRYQFKGAKQIGIKIHKNEFDSQAFFASLPSALFRSLDGIKTSGKLSFNLDFFVDLTKVDSLVFDAGMRRHNFKIISFGRANLSKPNGPFEYTAYNNEGPVRTFTMGEGFGSYTRLSEISPYLQNAVLTSEDPGFFSHRGFIMDALRESFITNIKEKRFARGGSTISMQFVKNVFLTRHKNIARKFEEILVTWLIENTGIVPKERVFEIYLNAIEWGNNIYGVREAAQFYFAKSPAKLNLPESMFLAYMIPHPRWYKSSFNTNQSLRPGLIGYFNLVAGKMISRGLATEGDSIGMVSKFKLSGPALQGLLKQTIDSIPEASTDDAGALLN